MTNVLVDTPNGGVAVIGSGWAGTIVAAELARKGHRVVIFERGEGLEGTQCGHVHEPGGERRSRKRVQRIGRETFTLRHDVGSSAFPLRRLDVFQAGEGLGGAGVLWGGLSPRFKPQSFMPFTTYRQRLESLLPALPIRYVDWPITYDDLEPYYGRFEQIAGVAGQDGADPYEGRRSTPYPIAYEPSTLKETFRDAVAAGGLTPYPLPTAEITTAYTNSDGITRAPCAEFGSSIATPLNTTIPFALATGRVSIRTGCSVRRILHSNGTATGLIFTDSAGTYHRYDADQIVLAGWTFTNTRLLLLSEIGKPYDPATESGVVGRNYANHVSAGATLYWDRTRGIEPQDSGWAVSDFDPVYSDADGTHVGGAQIASTPPGNLGYRDGISLPSGHPKWGPGFVDTIRRYANSYLKINILGEVVPQRDRFLDLDPTYRDVWGDPLLRITFDYGPNERAMVATVGGRLDKLLKATDASVVDVTKSLDGPYDASQYQNSHASGGTIMGSDPLHSVVDANLQSWSARNLWIVGASVFPSNPAPNPTPTVAALAYRLADHLDHHIRGLLAPLATAPQKSEFLK